MHSTRNCGYPGGYGPRQITRCPWRVQSQGTRIRRQNPGDLTTFFYPPQCSCGKVMFLHLSVGHSVQSEVSSRHHPPGQTPPLSRPPCPVHAGIHHPPGGHCSGRYACYWNAFLYFATNNLSECLGEGKFNVLTFTGLRWW